MHTMHVRMSVCRTNRKEKRQANARAEVKHKRMVATSKLVEHVEKYHHQLNLSKVEAWEQDWKRRAIKESILTQERLGKTINDTHYILQVFG